MSANEKCRHGLFRQECEFCQKGIARLRAIVEERGIGRPRIAQQTIPTSCTAANKAKVAKKKREIRETRTAVRNLCGDIRAELGLKDPPFLPQPWKPEPPDEGLRFHDYELTGEGLVRRERRRRTI